MCKNIVNYKTLGLEIAELTAPCINTSYVMHCTLATVKLDCGRAERERSLESAFLAESELSWQRPIIGP